MGKQAGGVGRYARELLGAMLAAQPSIQLTVFVTRSAPADLRDEAWAGAARFVTLPMRGQGALAAGIEHTALPVLAAALRLDVLHSPGNTGPVLTPGLASVVTVHDLIWLHHADEWERDERVRRAIRRQVTHVLRHADHIFTTTQAVADDLCLTLGARSSQLCVTPMGVRPQAAVPTSPSILRDRLRLGPARVLLCVAQKRPYKNQAALVRALPSLEPDVTLVLPGAPTGYEAQLRRLADDLGVADRVRFPEWLSEGDLAGLYVLSDVFSLPSQIEGFGLPVLEAMAHDLPVACSEIPALAEITGAAALRFNPGDQEAVIACLVRLFADADLRATLVRNGQAQVARFTWRRTAEASLAGYHRALAHHR